MASINYGTPHTPNVKGVIDNDPNRPVDPNSPQYNQAAGDQPSIGGYFGGANKLAGQYGQQASLMGGQQFSDRYSSQDAGVVDASRQAQLAALAEQQRVANGGVTASQQQMQQGIGVAQAGQNAAAASAVGGGPAMAAAQRQAAFGGNTIATQGGNDLAALRANEMAAARDRYAQGSSDLRGQDQQLWGMGQQRDLAQAGLQDQGMLASQGMANSILGAQLGSDVSAYGTRAQSGYDQALADADNRAKQRAAQTSAAMAAGAAITTAAGTAMSDINAKTGIQSASGMWAGGDTANGVTMNQPAQPAPPFNPPNPQMSFGGPPQLNTMNTLARTKNGAPAMMPSGSNMVSEGTKARQPVPPMLMSDERTKFFEEKPEFKRGNLYDTNPSYLKYFMGHEGPAPGSDAVKNHNNYYHPSYGDSKGSHTLMSDERLKTNAHGGAADGFLDSLTPFTYRYKDPANEPTDSPTGGQYLGVMAQNVEKSPTGSTIVKDTPRGKMLEGAALQSAQAAGLGRLHERVKMLEAERGK